MRRFGRGVLHPMTVVELVYRKHLKFLSISVYSRSSGTHLQSTYLNQHDLLRYIPICLIADIESSTKAGMRRLPGPEPITESDPFRSIKTSNGIPNTPSVSCNSQIIGYLSFSRFSCHLHSGTPCQISPI